MATTKVSVTIDDEILAEARQLAPGGNLSALLNQALADQVRHARLRAIVEADRAELGPPPPAVVAWVDEHWPF